MSSLIQEMRVESDGLEVLTAVLSACFVWNKKATHITIAPTDAMCEAAWESEGTDYVGEHLRIWQIAPAYRAMIAAAGKE